MKHIYTFVNTYIHTHFYTHFFCSLSLPLPLPLPLPIYVSIYLSIYLSIYRTADRSRWFLRCIVCIKVRRCSTLSRGSTFFELAKVFRQALRQYNRALREKMPKPSNKTVNGGDTSSTYGHGSTMMSSATAAKLNLNNLGSSLEAAAKGFSMGLSSKVSKKGRDQSNEDEKKGTKVDGADQEESSDEEDTDGSKAEYALGITTVDAEVTVLTSCICVNTAEYCASTIDQLSSLLQTRADAEFRPLIEPVFTSLTDAVYGTIAMAIRVIATGVGRRIQPHLMSMVREDWMAQRAAVVDVSPTVKATERILRALFV